jgi:hypothetical protein
MTAQINYWNQDTHKGPMLGYPDLRRRVPATPPSQSGIGNNAEDALVSLVSSEYSGAAEAPNLWKALEAVLYRNVDSLAGSWNAAPRDHTVHQSWFSSREAGKSWEIRPRPQTASASEPPATEPNTPPKPTPEQFASLAELNRLQTEADTLGRELAALQQDLYARWWMLCEKSRRDPSANSDSERSAPRRAGRVSDSAPTSKKRPAGPSGKTRRRTRRNVARAGVAFGRRAALLDPRGSGDRLEKLRPAGQACFPGPASMPLAGAHRHNGRGYG